MSVKCFVKVKINYTIEENKMDDCATVVIFVKVMISYVSMIVAAEVAVV